MVIVSGHIEVSPEDRAAYLATCVPVVEAARQAEGCLDFALSADLVDVGRINVFERWETEEAVNDFRGAGVGDDQSSMILGADVREFAVAAERKLA
ncbi:MAG: hypothetical protein JWR85_501 [Marmoricola sp.]|nr:hypothetical protein [Marmoricola sp.]